MMDILQPILELAVIFPGLLLAYLPMKHYLRMAPGKLTAMIISLLSVLCIGGGSLCCFLKIKTDFILLGIILISTVVYIHTLTVSRWKSINIILAIYAAFACLSSIANAINAILYPGSNGPWFCLHSGVIWLLMCTVFTVLVGYPFKYAVQKLLADEIITQTWYILWILPIVFIGVNQIMISASPKYLNQGYVLEGYIVINLTLLAMLCLLYILYYYMTMGMSNYEHMKRQNDFLFLQHAQYDTLLIAIEEARHARHDIRHHFNTLSRLAQQKNWTALEEYLGNAQNSIPRTELNLCDNHAIDAVAGHYGTLYRSNHIPFSMKIDLPQKLPVSEVDICVILSNLLENALEASLRTKASKRHIKVQARLHSSHIVLINVENTFDGCVKKKNGVFQSSKRKGPGTGLGSVRYIAEKTGGYSRFIYENGIFCAQVMLRADPNAQEKPDS